MTWWHAGTSQGTEHAPSRELNDDTAPLTPLSIDTRAYPDLPEDLDELLAVSKTSGLTLNHVQSWRAVTAFARRHWLAEVGDVEKQLQGEFFALKHAVADQLGLDDDAEAARLQWLRWAEETGLESAVFHARSYATHAEAERFIDAHPGNALTGAKPTDAQVPELVALTRDILQSRPEPQVAYYYSLPAAVAGAAAALARREDLAEALAAWSATWAPRTTGADDRRLLEAQVAHSHGDLARAAAICAQVAEHPVSEPVTSTIEARQMLAYLSLEADAHDEAIRQLYQFVEPALAADLVVATLRSVRLLTALLNADQRAAEALRIGVAALAQTAGMPISPLIMDIQLITARSYLDTGQPAECLRLAEPVAQWSELTDDDERTDTAYDIAITAADRAQQIDTALALSHDHARYLTRIGDAPGASRALQNAARKVAFHQRISEAEDLLEQARASISATWDIAHWRMSKAYVQWSADEVGPFFSSVRAAAAGYAEAGDTESAAEALLQGVYCAREVASREHIDEFATGIQTLLPEPLWRGHPILGVLDEYLREDG